MRKIIDAAKEKIVNDSINSQNKAKLIESFTTLNDASIDDLMRKGLWEIQRLLTCISYDIDTGSPSRETVMNLKDCMTMLHELKKKEQELLDDMSTEELEKIVNK